VAAAERLKEESGSNDLIERIASDPSFGLTREEIAEVLDPARHIGRAPEQVDIFLRESVQPILDAATAAAPDTELRA
jgi:adenylosuccinate lyase